jgi:geranylgeranyl pyrophosphate synthase
LAWCWVHRRGCLTNCFCFILSTFSKRQQMPRIQEMTILTLAFRAAARIETDDLAVNFEIRGRRSSAIHSSDTVQHGLRPGQCVFGLDSLDDCCNAAGGAIRNVVSMVRLKTSSLAEESCRMRCLLLGCSGLGAISSCFSLY